ncbi:MRN complex-interacting protein isoform X2 [Pteropus medius]|uniref:MRN complex-interacting protein isoform X2 n=1 Tax=Pteropus vampyrus TaxID=132908 RepID=UPI00196A6D06|nr:MRN complex-interacting protein isoform X2 [Pteropus giganteus]
MAPPPQIRVLRCCSCRLFQAHQVKKSHKWTCKACGEKQSFLRTYGEGSGADCRRHVQKLNLLQGQISEMSLRSLEEPINANDEKNAGPGQAKHTCLQEKSPPSENRWLKYLERSSEKVGLKEGVCFSRQPSSATKKPYSPNTSLPRKRRWSQSTARPPCIPSGQDLGNSEDTLETQDHTGLAESVGERSCCEEWDTREFTGPWQGPPCPAQWVRSTSSKWDQFLLTPGNSSHVDTEPLIPLQRSPRPGGGAQAEQTPREGGLSRIAGVLQLSQATHTPMAEPKRPFGETPKHIWGTGPQAEGGPLVKGAQEPGLVRLGDLFNTGEDFDDDL